MSHFYTFFGQWCSAYHYFITTFPAHINELLSSFIFQPLKVSDKIMGISQKIVTISKVEFTNKSRNFIRDIVKVTFDKV